VRAVVREVADEHELGMLVAVRKADRW